MESEKQRADDYETKYSEAQESSEERRKKLEETEKKASQLQESVTRYLTIYSFQKDFAHMNVILNYVL